MQSPIFVNEVKLMAISLLQYTFNVKISGVPKFFCLETQGWIFQFNDECTAIGQCNGSRKTIYLSKFLLERYDEDMAWWKSIILHEIAHAIDVEVRGHSNHDRKWQDISNQIGGLTATNTKVKYLPSVKMVYEAYCPICGYTEQAVRYPENMFNGNCSCGECAPHGYDSDYPIHIRKL